MPEWLDLTYVYNHRPAVANTLFLSHSFLVLAGKFILFRSSDSGTLKYHAGIVAGGSCMAAMIMIYFSYMMSYLCDFQQALASYNSAHGLPNSVPLCSASVDAAIGTLTGTLHCVRFL